MSRRSYTWNAFETKLTGPLPALSTSVAVESTAGLDDPAYLVVDPDVPAKREWIRVGTITPELFENIVRDQEGSVGNIDHDTGALVRAVFTKQLQDDLFDDVESIEKSIQDHVNIQIQPDPHPQYLLEDTAENTYVPLAGTQAQLPMTGPLTLFGAPTADLHAATRLYVDDRDVETLAAAAADAANTYLPLVGGAISGNLDMTNGTIANVQALTEVRTIVANYPENVSFELGRTDGTASTVWFDFHTGAVVTDRDSRIIATGGDGTSGGGRLEIQASELDLNGDLVRVSNISASVADYGVIGSEEPQLHNIIVQNPPLTSGQGQIGDLGCVMELSAERGLYIKNSGTNWQKIA